MITSNWKMIEGKKREYLALEMRGKALDVVVGLEEEKLIERTGVEMLRELEKYYVSQK